MKLIIFLIGVVLSVWVSAVIYTPTQAFVTDIKEIYLKSKATQRTISQKSEATINTITESYKEIARVFGVKVAEESIKEEVSNPTPA
jgi:flavin reductase (DIM6/NTAB) family NADH-FMN oxidoreductase RutF